MNQTASYPTLADIPARIPNPLRVYALLELYWQLDQGNLSVLPTSEGWQVRMNELPSPSLAAWADAYVSTSQGEEGTAND